MENAIQNILITGKNLFMRFGIKSVSMDDLARELGMSKRTLYKYFSSKKELVKKIVFHHAQEEERMMRSIQEMDIDAIQEMLLMTDYIQKLITEMKPTILYDLRKYYREAWKIMESLHYDFVRDSLIQNIIKGQQSGLYREEIVPDIVANMYTYMAFGIMTNPMMIGPRASLADIHLSYMDYHLHAIMTSKGLNLYHKYQQDDE